MKKALLMIGLGITLLLSGCGSNGEEMASSQSTTAVQQEQPAGTQATEEKEEESILDAFPKHEMVELSLKDNFFAISGDEILYEDDDFRLRLAGEMELTDQYTVQTEYVLPVKIELKKENYSKTRGFAVVDAIINDVVVPAHLYINYEGSFNFVEENKPEVSYIVFDRKAMYGMQQMLQDPVIKKLQINVYSYDLNTRKWYHDGEVIRSNDCPDEFPFSDRMELVYSDDWQEIYYGGFLFMSGERDVYYLWGKKAKEVGDSFWISASQKQLYLDEQKFKLPRTASSNSEEVLRKNTSAPLIMMIETSALQDCEPDQKWKLEFSEFYSYSNADLYQQKKGPNHDMVSVELDFTEELMRFVEEKKDKK